MPVLGRQRQGDPGGSLASQTSCNHEPQVKVRDSVSKSQLDDTRERLPKFTAGLHMHTSRHTLAHIQIYMHTHEHIHTLFTGKTKEMA